MTQYGLLLSSINRKQVDLELFEGHELQEEATGRGWAYSVGLGQTSEATGSTQNSNGLKHFALKPDHGLDLLANLHGEAQKKS